MLDVKVIGRTISRHPIRWGMLGSILMAAGILTVMAVDDTTGLNARSVLLAVGAAAFGGLVGASATWRMLQAVFERERPEADMEGDDRDSGSDTPDEPS